MQLFLQKPDKHTYLRQKAHTEGMKATLKLLPASQALTVIGIFAIVYVFDRRNTIDIADIFLFTAVTITAVIWSLFSHIDIKKELIATTTVIKHMVLAGFSSGFYTLLGLRLFPQATDMEAVFLAALTTSMIASGAFVLATTPKVAMVWISVLGLGTAYALLL